MVNRSLILILIVLSATFVCAQDFPLLRARRSQETPFNNSCPIIDGKRVVVGCVATAVEHIVNYWHHPNSLYEEIPEYVTEKYSLPAVPKGTFIDWKNMQEDYLDSPYTEDAAKAVADLSLWIGQALRANYGVLATSASSWSVPDVLKNVFGYKTVEICCRDSYTAPAWRRLLKHELDNGRPMYFSGYYSGGGHAWVMDGWKNENYHCNWGENNFRDGYYNQDFFNEYQNVQDSAYLERFGGFASNQLCICISPDEVETLAWDSIHTQDFVRVHGVKLLREASAEGFVLADVILENTHEDTLYYTLEGVSFTPDVWQRGEEDEMQRDGSYCGVCSFVLPPLSTTTQRACFRFSKTGQRVFAVTFDEVEYVCDTLIEVLPARSLSLIYSDMSVSFPKVGNALIDGCVTNTSASATYGSVLYFWLVEEGVSPEDEMQDNVSVRYIYLNIGPGEMVRYSEQTELHSPVLFKDLTVGKTYSLWLRQNWLPIVKTLTFTVPDHPSGIQTRRHVPASIEGHNDVETYDLSGRKLTYPRGYYIKDNKVYWSPK